jgi:uncharacterized protein
VTTVVLDTNTLLSGTLTATTPPGQIIDAWRAGRFEVAISDPILAECTRHLTTDTYFRRRLTGEQITDYLRLLNTMAIPVAITAQVQGVATHPEDDLVLATALSAQAEYLVTGDRMLRSLGTFQSVAIVSPADFVVQLQQGL